MAHQPSLLPPDLPTAVTDLVLQHGWYDLYQEVLRQRPFQAVPSGPVPSAPARRTDPETSHMAGPRSGDVRKFSAKSRQAKLLAVFATQPLTDQQATVRVVGAAAAPSAFDGCRRRCSDLRAAGYIRDSGRRKKNAGSDDLAIVWEITELGKFALDNLNQWGWSR